MASDGDDFKNWNPRKYWAKANSEIVCQAGVSQVDQKAIDKLAKYLDREHTIEEIISHLKFKRGEIIRLFGVLRGVKSMSLERIESKGILGYRIRDFRKS